jgi:hypothetical protein
LAEESGAALDYDFENDGSGLSQTKSGGEHAVQALREVRGRRKVAPASGVRVSSAPLFGRGEDFNTKSRRRKAAMRNIPKGFHHSAQGWPRSGLPWVHDNKNQNPNGVSSTGRGGGGMQPVGVGNYFVGRLTQGSSRLATAGLRAGIPSGFSNGTRAAVNRPQSRRFAKFADARLPRQRLECAWLQHRFSDRARVSTQSRHSVAENCQYQEPASDILSSGFLQKNPGRS